MIAININHFYVYPFVIHTSIQSTKAVKSETDILNRNKLSKFKKTYQLCIDTLP